MAEEKEQIQAAPVNADIEGFLLASEVLEIDFLFGLTEYFRYLEDMRLLEMGVKFKDLGISTRRHSGNPSLIVPNSAAPGTFSFVDRFSLNDPESEIQAGSIALLKLQGVMRSQSGMSAPGVDRLINDLRAAYGNDRIQGVIIETNSGGGESLSGTMLKSAIQERNKPVIGFGHLVASAAYRALSGADEIIASGGGAEFGSIGTMVTIDQKILNKYRERFADFYGTGAPGKNEDFRAAIAGDFSKIQNKVDRLTAAFQKEIAKERNLQGGKETVKETLNGSVFAAEDAKKRGLVDMVGNMQTAVKRIKALRGKY